MKGYKINVNGFLSIWEEKPILGDKPREEWGDNLSLKVGPTNPTWKCEMIG